MACDQWYDDTVAQLLDLGAHIPIADTSGRMLGIKSTTLLTVMIKRGGQINRTLCERFIFQGARLDHALCSRQLVRVIPRWLVSWIRLGCSQAFLA